MTKPIRLAIVDDHEMIRKTWKMVLQQDERLQVIAECASGADAIVCARELAPDIMLMDINMSPVNGFEATDVISKSFPAVKIIGISINNQPAYARNLMRLGAKGYVTKNSGSQEMMEAIFIVNDGGTYICKDIEYRLTEKPF
jgi:DNA-binding NarL/FixJ family response regulator